MSGLVKNFHTGIFPNTTNVINDKACMMVLLIEPYLFISLWVSDLDHSSRSQQHHTVLTEKNVLFWSSWNFASKVDNECTTIFHFCTYSVESFDQWVFWFDKNLNVGLFCRLCLREVFQTVHDYDLAWGLLIPTSLMTLTLFQQVRIINCKLVCLKKKKFRFLSTVLKCLWLLHPWKR